MNQFHVLFVALVLCAGCAPPNEVAQPDAAEPPAPAEPQPKPKPARRPQPAHPVFDAAMLEAWAERDLKPSWFDDHGGNYVLVQEGKERSANALPVFQISFERSIDYSRPFTDDDLKDLPTADAPFGIHLFPKGKFEVTAAGLKHLARHKSLTYLYVAGYVTEPGLNNLAGLTNLTHLDIGGPQIGDSALKALAPFQRLTFLGLDQTSITDAGLKEVAQLKNLITLVLTHTKVTDAGLKDVGALKNLVHLKLHRTQVTDAGVKELQRTLPKCKITR